jgi:hypothetical protein
MSLSEILCAKQTRAVAFRLSPFSATASLVSLTALCQGHYDNYSKIVNLTVNFYAKTQKFDGLSASYTSKETLHNPPKDVQEV